MKNASSAPGVGGGPGGAPGAAPSSIEAKLIQMEKEKSYETSINEKLLLATDNVDIPARQPVSIG